MRLLGAYAASLASSPHRASSKMHCIFYSTGYYFAIFSLRNRFQPTLAMLESIALFCLALAVCYISCAYSRCFPSHVANLKSRSTWCALWMARWNCPSGVGFGKAIEAMHIDNVGGISSPWRSDGKDKTAPLAVIQGGKSLSSEAQTMNLATGDAEVRLPLSLKDTVLLPGKTRSSS